MKDDRLLFDRRTLLRMGGSGIAAALASHVFSPLSALAAPAAKKPAKACIVLWLNGGPSHIDTFDPKPGAATGGKFKAIKTRAKGVEIAEHLPGIADVGNHIVVTAWGGVRYVPARSEAGPPGRFSKATGVRIIASYRAGLDEREPGSLVLGVEFEPDYVLPPYSIDKWMGAH